MQGATCVCSWTAFAAAHLALRWCTSSHKTTAGTDAASSKAAHRRQNEAQHNKARGVKWFRGLKRVLKSAAKVRTSRDAVPPLSHAGVLLEETERLHRRMPPIPAAVDSHNRHEGGVCRAVVACAQPLAGGADADVAVHEKDLAAACMTCMAGMSMSVASLTKARVQNPFAAECTMVF